MKRTCVVRQCDLTGEGATVPPSIPLPQMKMRCVVEVGEIADKVKWVRRKI
jgi:hypothetical protein